MLNSWFRVSHSTHAEQVQYINVRSLSFYKWMTHWVYLNISYFFKFPEYVFFKIGFWCHEWDDYFYHRIIIMVLFIAYTTFFLCLNNIMYSWMHKIMYINALHKSSTVRSLVVSLAAIFAICLAGFIICPVALFAVPRCLLTVYATRCCALMRCSSLSRAALFLPILPLRTSHLLWTLGCLARTRASLHTIAATHV